MVKNCSLAILRKRQEKHPTAAVRIQVVTVKMTKLTKTWQGLICLYGEGQLKFSMCEEWRLQCRISFEIESTVFNQQHPSLWGSCLCKPKPFFLLPASISFPATRLKTWMTAALINHSLIHSQTQTSQELTFLSQVLLRHLQEARTKLVPQDGWWRHYVKWQHKQISQFQSWRTDDNVFSICYDDLTLGETIWWFTHH